MIENRVFYIFIVLMITTALLVSCSTDNTTADAENYGSNTSGIENLPDESGEVADEGEKVEEIQGTLVKTRDERHNRYNFAYRRSALSIRKEVFDEHNLTEEHIQNFFDAAELAYDKLAEFFLNDRYWNFGVFYYHLVPRDFSEPALYEDYSHILGQPHPSGGFAVAWADIIAQSNETFYEENMLARYLSMSDIGFPRIVAHELGHLFTTSPAAVQRGFSVKEYVWCGEMLADLAVYFLASEMSVIRSNGEIVTGHTGTDFYFSRFFGLGEKYGFDIIGAALREIEDDTENFELRFNLFKEILSGKSGDDIGEHFTPNDDDVIIQARIVFEGYYRGHPTTHYLAPVMLYFNPATTTRVLLSNFALDNSALEALTSLVNVTMIFLEGNQISDISALAGLANLPYLMILVLQNNQISDVSPLANFANLTDLSLVGNQISDVRPLKGLTNLAFLMLGNNPLTAEQIAELREALPNTQIFADY